MTYIQDGRPDNAAGLYVDTTFLWNCS